MTNLISNNTSSHDDGTSLIKILNIDLIAERFKANSRVGSSFGGATFKGIDLQTNQPVFMKYLICPRGKRDRAKFLMERDALDCNSNIFGYTLTPQKLHFEEFDNLETMVLITDWVEGEDLTAWLGRADKLSIDERLKVFHRIVFAMSMVTSLYQHRDLHPGNIMLLPEKMVEMSPSLTMSETNPAVMVLDWGESLPVLKGNYDDEPDHVFDMIYYAPREITGALTSLPPEVFSPWKKNGDLGGKYESWGLGLFLYRVLTLSSLWTPPSLGDYATEVSSGKLRKRVANYVAELKELNLPGGDILPGLFEWMMKEKPEHRAEISVSGRIMYDVRYEKLNISNPQELSAYFKNPYDYVPKGGWKFSRKNDYD